jgi:hypothetical protein
VTFVTVALRERLIVLPCACGSDKSRPVLAEAAPRTVTVDSPPMTIA